MSRSNPAPANPAKRFFRWRGEQGELTYYDKEKQEEIVVKRPFTFMVLDELATITGFCEPEESSYWSNEVRSVAREELTVKTSKGVKQVGLYKDLADVRSKGAKYAKSIYIAFKDNEEDGWKIGNIRAHGAALTAWIEFGNKQITELGKITLVGSETAKKGKTVYHIPTFEWTNAETEEDEIAKELDQELQIYLAQYLAGVPTESFSDGTPVPDEVHEVGEEPVDLEEVPARFR